jgi:hypothetical protein
VGRQFYNQLVNQVKKGVLEAKFGDRKEQTSPHEHKERNLEPCYKCDGGHVWRSEYSAVRWASRRRLKDSPSLQCALSFILPEGHKFMATGCSSLAVK